MNQDFEIIDKGKTIAYRYIDINLNWVVVWQDVTTGEKEQYEREIKKLAKELDTEVIFKC